MPGLPVGFPRFLGGNAAGTTRRWRPACDPPRSRLYRQHRSLYLGPGRRCLIVQCAVRRLCQWQEPAWKRGRPGALMKMSQLADSHSTPSIVLDCQRVGTEPRLTGRMPRGPPSVSRVPRPKGGAALQRLSLRLSRLCRAGAAVPFPAAAPVTAPSVTASRATFEQGLLLVSAGPRRY
jgi:hypothetical protein